GAPAALPAQQPESKKYALLVGVNEYDKNELRNLQYSDSDVTALADLLQKAGYKRIVLMTQKVGAKQSRYLPMAEKIREELKGLLEGRQPGDTVLIAFAGHGIQFKDTDEPFFCPMDAKL